MLDTLANVGLASLKSGVSPRKTGTNREELLWGAALLSPSAPVNSLSSERNGGRFDGGPDPAVQEPLRRAADNGWLSSGVFPGRVMLLAVRGRFRSLSTARPTTTRHLLVGAVMAVPITVLPKRC